MAAEGPATGERAWTIKEIVQGKPWGHPTHAMFIHFPVAFSIGALALDLGSRIGHFPEAPLAATWLLLGGALGAVPAAVTGSIDWWGMVPGSTKRRVATRHMILQLISTTIFAAALALRWQDRHIDEARTAWLLIEGAGLVVLTWGQWVGGELVYRMGMRVSTGPRPKRPTA